MKMPITVNGGNRRMLTNPPQNTNNHSASDTTGNPARKAVLPRKTASGPLEYGKISIATPRYAEAKMKYK
ncbi:hypothetical protein [Reyranella sp.]|uniref:hypothetical protein n=1 Tax=Reyranella sp. TaxID=1929291 RepID=UPI003BA8B4E5